MNKLHKNQRERRSKYRRKSSASGRANSTSQAPVAVARTSPGKRFELVFPAGMHEQIRKSLFDDPSTEQLGVVLAGVSKQPSGMKLLACEYIVPPTTMVQKSLTSVRANSRFSQWLMQRCAAEGLSQIDIHSHPFGANRNLHFSGTDDVHEQAMARYIYRHLPNTFYASIVMNQGYTKGRVWLPAGAGVCHREIETLKLVDFPLRQINIGKTTSATRSAGSTDDRYDRQVRAYGTEGQSQMAQNLVCVIGAGGLGSIVIEMLARLGFSRINIIDPDIAEISNLNRVVGMTYADAKVHTPKATIAARSVKAINPRAQVKAYQKSVFDPSVLPALTYADLIIVATDNHSTRLFVQRVGAQYLIPVVSIGVNIDVDEKCKLEDVSAEYAIALPGAAGWCLQCAETINPELAAFEIASPAEQKRWIDRGYVRGADIPSPSVRHLNGIIAGLAVAEIHNLVAPFKSFRPFLVYNQLQTEIMPMTIARNANCPICSEKGLLGLGDLEPIPDFLRDLREPPELPAPS